MFSSGNRISYGKAAGISVMDEGKAEIIGSLLSDLFY